MTKPVVTLDVAQQVPIQSIKFNPKVKGYFATGDHQGSVKIWQLNSHLTNPQAQEQEKLMNIEAGKGLFDF